MSPSCVDGTQGHSPFEVPVSSQTGLSMGTLLITNLRLTGGRCRNVKAPSYLELGPQVPDIHPAAASRLLHLKSSCNPAFPPPTPARKHLAFGTSQESWLFGTH